jgi:hypothetical protein
MYVSIYNLLWRYFHARQNLIFLVCRSINDKVDRLKEVSLFSPDIHAYDVPIILSLLIKLVSCALIIEQKETKSVNNFPTECINVQTPFGVPPNVKVQ